MVRRMILTALEGIPSVMPGDHLAVLVVEACKRSDLVLEDSDAIVLAQKIVSKTEGQTESVGRLIKHKACQFSIDRCWRIADMRRDREFKLVVSR
jgi:F420-0:gamma-glutamyl ligase